MSCAIVDVAACEILTGLKQGLGKGSPALWRQPADFVDQFRSGRDDVFDRVENRPALVEIGRHQACIDSIESRQQGRGDILQYQMASSRYRGRAVEPIEVVAVVDAVKAIRRSLSPGDFLARVGAPGAIDVAIAGEDGEGVRAVAVAAAIVFALHQPVFLRLVQTLPTAVPDRRELDEAVGVAAVALAECVQACPASQCCALEPAIGRTLWRFSYAGAPVDPRRIALSGVLDRQIEAPARLDRLRQAGGGVHDQQHVGP